MAIAYRAARVFDGTSEELIAEGAVMVDGERITFVGPARAAPSEAEWVDLGDATLLPGLVDAHVHLVWSASALPHEVVERESRYLTAMRCAANAARQLRAGVTSMRDLGSTDGMAIEVGRAIELGIIAGPRVVPAGRAIAMTGGHGWFLAREADGPDAVRHAVRSELKGGAQCIKLMASGGIYGHAEEIGDPQLTVEEMQAAVEEGHKAGRKVTAHAYSPRAIANALDAGVDSIEHGSLIDGELAERMAREGKYLVPTLSVYRAMAERGPQLGTADYIIRKTAVVVEASRRAVALALEAGVPLATGTDCGSPGHPHGSLAEEIIALVEAGARPAQALRCATAAAADLLGLSDEVGTLTPGKRADLVAVGEDPLRDPRALRGVRLVLKDGRQVWPPDAGR